MHNWSLVCFTLLSQGAVGLVWLSVLGRWFGPADAGGLSIWPLLTGFVLTGLALYAALGHLGSPRLAPQAGRNVGGSWLSREVVLVQAFGAALALLVILALFDSTWALWFWEGLALLAGSCALLAMTRVYLLRTVPAWNHAGTPLEFAGSALVLGGALEAGLLLMASDPQSLQLGPGLAVCGLGLVLGLVLKVAALPPGLKAMQAVRHETWSGCEQSDREQYRILALRQGLSLAGLGLFLAALGLGGPGWLWALAALSCFSAAEVLGRWRFYGSYARLGL